MQSSGETALARTRQLTAADKIALAFAAFLVAILTLARNHTPNLGPRRALIALVITAAFAVLGWYGRGVNIGGALAGSAIAFIMAAREIRLFCVLLLVFMVTLAATRLGTHRKKQLRAAEAQAGRSASQVMANLGVAGLITSMVPAGWPVLALAALAEAAADTSSSEIGLAFPGKTVLITNWKPTRPGIDGGISRHGTLAALLVSSGIALAARFAALISTRQTVVVAAAGFFGTLVDSLLGALVERRGWLNNDLVNLLSTAAAVGVAWLWV
jgi:uncharacterized protein (TIGR00297 family)